MEIAAAESTNVKAQNVKLAKADNIMKKLKVIEMGELYTISSSRPMFNNPSQDRSIIEKTFDWHTKPFVILEKKTYSEDSDPFVLHAKTGIKLNYGWYKVLTVDGIVGWIFSQNSYFKRVRNKN